MRWMACASKWKPLLGKQLKTKDASSPRQRTGGVAPGGITPDAPRDYHATHSRAHPQRHRGAERLQDMRFHVSSLFVSLCTFRFESRWGYFFRPYTVRVFTTLRDSVLHSCNIGVPVRSIPPLFDQPVECACSLRIALGVDMEIPFGRDAGGAWPSL